jgi:hypothetical protein
MMNYKGFESKRTEYNRAISLKMSGLTEEYHENFGQIADMPAEIGAEYVPSTYLGRHCCTKLLSE